jgi:pyruvate dehydrogenase E1 component beta subunit
MTQKKFSEAINDALHIAMEIDSSVICFGLGVTDPKGVFGTTLNLEKKFGSERVFDMPTSENAMTGVAIGAALNGIKSITTHQRLDFFLLAMDQLVNSASKWHYMFGGQKSVPITVRLIIGRGWGQGPTHSQNLHAWFAHIPGLKVVMPSTPEDAKGLLLESIFDPNPVVFLEHRWLHNTVGEVPDGNLRVKLGSARIAKNGKDITIVSSSYMTIEALHAANYLQAKNISCEVIDLRSIKPLDWPTIRTSLERTGRLLVLDSGFTTCSFSSEIITLAVTDNSLKFKATPARLAMPDVPEPASYALTKGFYIRALDVALKIIEMTGSDANLENIKFDLQEPEPHDVPGDWFKGPF